MRSGWPGCAARCWRRRAERVRPGRDDKVVAAWNGLAIAALAEAGLLLGEPEFVAAARGVAGLLDRVHLADGRLARTSRDGVAGPSAGVLEDYACVAEGFLALSGVTGEARWVTLAGQLLDIALDRFGDGSGGFYDTADDGETLVYRPADPADGPTPSGALRRRRGAAQLRRADRLGPAPRRGGGRAGRARADRGPVSRARLAGDWPWPRRCCPARPRSRWSGRPARPAPRSCTGPRCTPRRRARSSRSATGAGGGRHRAAGRARPGQRRPGRLRLPQLHLPGPGHRAGRAARRPGP